MGTREEIGFSKQEAYLALPNKLKEYFAVVAEAEHKPESEQQKSKPKTDKVPKTFLALVKEWIEIEVSRNSKKVSDHVRALRRGFVSLLRQFHKEDSKRRNKNVPGSGENFTTTSTRDSHCWR